MHIQGPSETDAARLRTEGTLETKPPTVQIKAMKGSWTEASAFRAVTSWLRLSTSQQTHIDVVAAQNDAMAVGAKKALQEFVGEGPARDHWLRIPFLGCDGVPKTGQAWVRSGILAATVIAPPLAGQGLEMLSYALQTKITPEEFTLVAPLSLPTLESLAASVQSRRV